MSGDGLRMALRGLAANRMRTALTMLGILIGVAAVILMVAVGSGISLFVQRQIETLGSNALYVHLAEDQTTQRGTSSRHAQLTRADVKALSTRASAVAAVSPIIAMPVTATFEGRTHAIPGFVGAAANFGAIRNITVADGRFYSEEDIASHAKVVVIGPTVADKLFSARSQAVGARIQLNNEAFRVIGVMEKKGASTFGDQDDVAAAPLTAVEDVLSGVTTSYTALAVQAASRDLTTVAQTQITQVLRSTHRLAADDADDFEVFNQADLLTTGKTATKAFTVVLGVVAAISLVVGGIGVMNIMLVTVTERTREIGIRKALGARRGDVVGQFLVEALVVSLLGGLAGILLALAASHVEVRDVKLVVQPLSIPIGFGVSALIGVFFGAWPASRAARLAPIEALRFQ